MSDGCALQMCEMAVTLSQISYSSGNESEVESETNGPTISKKARLPPKAVSWKLQQTFSNAEGAKKFMKRDWCIAFTNRGKAATTVQYYCRIYGQECNAKSKLVYPQSSMEVQYFENGDLQHTTTRKCGLSIAQKD